MSTITMPVKHHTGTLSANVRYVVWDSKVSITAITAPATGWDMSEGIDSSELVRIKNEIEAGL